jgi:hypothetical protein
VKDFQKIDWKLYNRPPFYQQWLCRGDTLRLAAFGDRGLAEADDQALALKDQWDLENVKARFLDRIGKLLNEYRNGGTDEYYRILLKLRRLLNTNDGSIPSIIKAIKFFYSSETVHIIPDYPAGLIIEHDGEGTPGLNFNRLLAEIIPAGVSFSTKELFDFLDRLLFSDSFTDFRIARNDKERFGKHLKYNGAIKYDGHTINSEIYVYSQYDGTHKYDGQLKYNGVRKIPRDYPVRPGPFKYSSRTIDRQDTSVKFEGFLDTVPLSDAARFLLNVVCEDAAEMGETAEVSVRAGYQEAISSAEAADMAVKIHAGDSVTMAETVVTGMRYHHAFDGQYKYDGGIRYDSTALQPLEV